MKAKTLLSIFLIWCGAAWAAGDLSAYAVQPGSTDKMTGPERSETSGEKGMTEGGMGGMGKMGMSHGMGRMGMMHGMMGKKKMAGVKGEARAGAAGRHGAEMRGAWVSPGIMQAFHSWTGCLMGHQRELGLTPEQLSRIDDAVTEHHMVAIRHGAEALALKVNVRHALRAEFIDLNLVRQLMERLAAQDVQLQMDGVELYKEMLGILTPDQRSKAVSLIGYPIPPPWREMAAGPCSQAAAGPAPAKGEESASEKAEQPNSKH